MLRCSSISEHVLCDYNNRRISDKVMAICVLNPTFTCKMLIVILLLCSDQVSGHPSTKVLTAGLLVPHRGHKSFGKEVETTVKMAMEKVSGIAFVCLPIH